MFTWALHEYINAGLKSSSQSVVPRFLLGHTAHMNYIEAHIESFHRIVQVDLVVFTFTFLCSQAFAAKLACAKDGWGSPNCSRMGGARAGGVVSHLKRSASNSARECRLRLRCFARFARFADEFQYSIVKNISWEPAILLFAHKYTVTMHERC